MAELTLVKETALKLIDENAVRVSDFQLIWRKLSPP